MFVLRLHLNWGLSRGSEALQSHNCGLAGFPITHCLWAADGVCAECLPLNKDLFVRLFCWMSWYSLGRRVSRNSKVLRSYELKVKKSLSIKPLLFLIVITLLFPRLLQILCPPPMTRLYANSLMPHQSPSLSLPVLPV